MKTAEDILLEAAEIIGRDGHHKGNYCSGDPTSSPVCAIGAINRAATGHALVDMLWQAKPGGGVGRNPVYIDATQRLASAAGIYAAWDIADWNDAPERSAEEVILAFKHAAHMEGPRT